MIGGWQRKKAKKKTPKKQPKKQTKKQAKKHQCPLPKVLWAPYPQYIPQYIPRYIYVNQTPTTVKKELTKLQKIYENCQRQHRQLQEKNRQLATELAAQPTVYEARLRELQSKNEIIQRKVEQCQVHLKKLREKNSDAQPDALPDPLFPWNDGQPALQKVIDGGTKASREQFLATFQQMQQMEKQFQQSKQWSDIEAPPALEFFVNSQEMLDKYYGPKPNVPVQTAASQVIAPPPAPGGLPPPPGGLPPPPGGLPPPPDGLPPPPGGLPPPPGGLPPPPGGLPPPPGGLPPPPSGPPKIKPKKLGPVDDAVILKQDAQKAAIDLARELLALKKESRKRWATKGKSFPMHPEETRVIELNFEDEKLQKAQQTYLNILANASAIAEKPADRIKIIRERMVEKLEADKEDEEFIQIFLPEFRKTFDDEHQNKLAEFVRQQSDKLRANDQQTQNQAKELGNRLNLSEKKFLDVMVYFKIPTLKNKYTKGNPGGYLLFYRSNPETDANPYLPEVYFKRGKDIRDPAQKSVKVLELTEDGKRLQLAVRDQLPPLEQWDFKFRRTRPIVVFLHEAPLDGFQDVRKIVLRVMRNKANVLSYRLCIDNEGRDIEPSKPVKPPPFIRKDEKERKALFSTKKNWSCGLQQQTKTIQNFINRIKPATEKVGSIVKFTIITDSKFVLRTMLTHVANQKQTKTRHYIVKALYDIVDPNQAEKVVKGGVSLLDEIGKGTKLKSATGTGVAGKKGDISDENVRRMNLVVDALERERTRNIIQTQSDTEPVLDSKLFKPLKSKLVIEYAKRSEELKQLKFPFIVARYKRKKIYRLCCRKECRDFDEVYGERLTLAQRKLSNTKKEEKTHPYYKTQRRDGKLVLVTALALEYNTALGGGCRTLIERIADFGVRYCIPSAILYYNQRLYFEHQLRKLQYHAATISPEEYAVRKRLIKKQYRRYC